MNPKSTLKSMMCALSSVVLSSLIAAEPLCWERTPNRPAPAQFDVFHGESIDFRCTFVGFGSLPFAGASDVRLWYQTNGMGAAWWSIPATVSSNALSATFTPDLDPGAERLTVFFGAPSNAYAAAQVRFRNSPGATPNDLQPPSVLDWQAELAAATNDLFKSFAPTITNTYTKAETDARIAELAPLGITTNDVCSIVTATGNWEWTGPGTYIASASELPAEGSADGEIYFTVSDITWIDDTPGSEHWDAFITMWQWIYEAGELTWATSSDWGQDHSHGEDADELTFDVNFPAGDLTFTARKQNALGLARLTDIAPTVSNTVTKSFVEDLGIESGIQFEEDPHWEAAKGGYATTGTVAQVSAAVGTLWSYVYGDSVWIAVTNYMRTIGGVSPSFQLWEVRDGVTNLVYWSKEEITNVTHDLIHDCKTNLEATVRNAVAEMPDKAWSKYQSATGNEAPDGVTIVSTPTIQLTGGGEWYRYVDVASNSVWFLKSNGLHTFGGDTNGYFRILDDEGNATFEVRKTDSYMVDAIASSVHFDGDGNFCVSFESNVEPVIYTTATLEHPNFLPQGDDPNVTVTWTKSGGVYTAKLEQAVKGPSLFAYAKVEVQGETVIRNTAPTDVSGGILCTDGIHKCRPVHNNGAITWEVMP